MSWYVDYYTYRLTDKGRRQLARDRKQWEALSAAMEKLAAAYPDDLEIATLYADRTTATESPAVTMRSVGSNGPLVHSSAGPVGWTSRWA